jgi:adenylate cyclase
MNPIAKRMYAVNQAFWQENTAEEQWRKLLVGADPRLGRGRLVFKRLPSNPRCRFCNAPFRGLGAPLMRLIGRGPSALNPLFCAICLDEAPVGGAEIELTMLFADIRGSTALAEKMSPMRYSQLIDRFFSTATEVLIQTDALINRLVGDQVIALYLPGFAGADHAARAVAAAKELLGATGHTDAAGPWIPVGIGIQTGLAFVGKVGQSGVTDITVLGDGANVAARLSSRARAGEILMSAATYAAAGLAGEGLQPRVLELKGRSEPMEVWSHSHKP